MTPAEHAELEKLKAENARLRALLEHVREHLYNPFEPDNQSRMYKTVDAALALTPCP